MTRLALAVFLTRPVSYRSPHTRAQCTGSLPHAIHRARHNAEHARLDQRPDAVISNEISLELPHKRSTQRRADLDGVEFGAVDDNGILDAQRLQVHFLKFHHFYDII